MPITDLEDPSLVRSNQRAELHAAVVQFFADTHKKNTVDEPLDPSEQELRALIVACDSEYVVKGMTEWLPAWRVCSF